MLKKRIRYNKVYFKSNRRFNLNIDFETISYNEMKHLTQK